jgi:hypothetical protein
MTKVADEWKADDDECHKRERLFHTISGKQGDVERGDSARRPRLRRRKIRSIVGNPYSVRANSNPALKSLGIKTPSSYPKIVATDG